MNHSIIMIPAKVKHCLYPLEYWHVSISIIAAKSMEYQEGKQKQVSDIGKTELFIGYNKKQDKQYAQDILYNPSEAVVWTYSDYQPENGEYNQ